MEELKYKGKTKAQWITLKGNTKGGMLGVSEEDVVSALLYFDEQEKNTRFDTEERRFQTQLDEAKLHGWWTRLIAGMAAGLSACSLVVAILALNKPPQQLLQAAQTISPVPAAPLLQATNSVPATPAQTKP